MQESLYLLTVERTAQRLEIGRTKVYELIAAGELESIKIGAARRIPVEALHAYIERLRADQSRVEAASGA